MEDRQSWTTSSAGMTSTAGTPFTAKDAKRGRTPAAGMSSAVGTQ